MIDKPPRDVEIGDRELCRRMVATSQRFGVSVVELELGGPDDVFVLALVRADGRILCQVQRPPDDPGDEAWLRLLLDMHDAILERQTKCRLN